MDEKKDFIEYVYDEIIKYLQTKYDEYTFDDSTRDNYLSLYIKKFIRTVGAIRELDIKGYHTECDILIRTLDEMLIDITYLELNPDENYKRLDLYSNYEFAKLVIERCEDDGIDIKDLNIDDVIAKGNLYEKKYEGKKSRWSGISFYDQAKYIDDNKELKVIKFIDLFKKIYRINCLYCHSSTVILKSSYSKLGIEVERDGYYINNINYVIIMTGMLCYDILPTIFNSIPNVLNEFENFMSGINLINQIIE